ncbi:hypothetical protein JXL83_01655 [candidate division WOR-3 bacterium]|nr:hypothetical protein [candidate division WOR-3 bacterium]
MKREEVEKEKLLSEKFFSNGDFEKAYGHFNEYLRLKEVYFAAQMESEERKLKLKQEVEGIEHELEIIRNEAEIMKTENERLERAKNSLEEEKLKSDSLLLSILPPSVAREMKENGKVSARLYDNVTVCIIGFPCIKKLLRMEINLETLEELSKIYTFFDETFEKMNCEKIKTFEEKYLAVCGLPVAFENHAENIIAATVENARLVKEIKKNNSDDWSLKVSVHSGCVIGGVVGEKKFLFDIFGDTINTASRIYDRSEAGKIYVSADTYDLVKDKIKNAERSVVNLKGVGKTEMYAFDYSAWI